MHTQIVSGHSLSPMTGLAQGHDANANAPRAGDNNPQRAADAPLLATQSSEGATGYKSGDSPQGHNGDAARRQGEDMAEAATHAEPAASRAEEAVSAERIERHNFAADAMRERIEKIDARLRDAAPEDKPHLRSEAVRAAFDLSQHERAATRYTEENANMAARAQRRRILLHAPVAHVPPPMRA